MCLLCGTDWVFKWNSGATDPPLPHAHFYGRFLLQKDKPTKPGNQPKRNDRSEIEERSTDKYFHFSSTFQTVNKYCIIYHIISYHLFSFRKSLEDNIIHMDVEIVIFVGSKG